MEPATYNDIWQNFIKPRGHLLMMLLSAFECVNMPSEDRIIYDLRFATAMARLHYARVPEHIPPANDVEGLWEYYKFHWNTPAGAAKKDDSIAKYYKLTSG